MVNIRDAKVTRVRLGYVYLFNILRVCTGEFVHRRLFERAKKNATATPQRKKRFFQLNAVGSFFLASDNVSRV